MSEYLCGSICTSYICKENDISTINMKKDMKWISELAIFLNSTNKFDISVFCQNSNLYSDFKTTNYDRNFIGFYYLEKLKEAKIDLKEKELAKEELINEIENSDWMIMCLQSSVFNDDNRFNGGHFVVIKGIRQNLVEIINPTIDSYEIIYKSIDFLIDCCKNFGNWRILVKRRNEK